MDSNKSDETPGKTTSERPLPRGLDDVSHLFLSRSKQERPQPEVAPIGPTVVKQTPQEVTGLTVALRPCPLQSREQLVSLVRKQPNALEQGMRVIDANLLCDNLGSIEVVAVSSAGQLTIIDIADGSSEQLLLRGMGHFDWTVRNLPNVRRMYQTHVINYSLQPRLFLVAAEFSASFQSVVRQFSSVQIHCLKYHAVALSGGIGVLFEHI
jgi:hypothetical protein